jgi:hypothetical protein
LPTELVWLHNGSSSGTPRSCGTAPFALHTELQRLGMLCLPVPEISVGQVLRNGIGERGFLFIKLRPELARAWNHRTERRAFTIR